MIGNIITNNYEFCRNILKNPIHMAVWTKLKLLSECHNFSLLDNINSNKKYNFMIDIFKNNVKEIINFLINENVNILLIRAIYGWHRL